MQGKAYWHIRKVILSIQFFLREKIYGINRKIYDEKQTLSFSRLVLKTLISQILKYTLLALLLLWGDAVLVPYLQITVFKMNLLPLNSEISVSIVLGGMGIAGVILGLYCSNITSIYSVKYANAPVNLSLLFQRDIITNRCVRQIVGYIILCIIMLGELIFSITISYLSILAILVMTVRIIIIFSIAGSRSNQLSNTFQISKNIYREILPVFKHISSCSFYASDANFQNHFQKICTNKLDDLKDVAYYNKNNPSNQNSSVVTFMSNNISILAIYWETKRSIPYNSLWFRDKPQYPQWHYASDSEIEIALKTGTSLRAKTARDDWWVEDNIEKINSICFEKLCKDRDFKAILAYINNVALLSNKAVNSNGITSWINMMRRLQSLFVSTCPEGKLTDADSQMIAAICDNFVGSFTSVVAGINLFLKQIDIQRVLEKGVEMSSLRDIDTITSVFFNNDEAEDILRRIAAECNIEGKKITPDWYTKQVLSKGIIQYLNKLADGLYLACDCVMNLGKAFLDKKQFFQAAVILSHSIEFISKSLLTLSIIEGDFEELNKYKMDTTIVWEDSRLETAQKKIEDVQRHLPKYLVKCSGAFALAHWTSREDYPDLLGLCYNYICEALIKSIEQNDYESFNDAYTDFLSVMLLYQEYIRTDVIKIKEPHRQQGVFHVATAPIIEYAIISGLAMLWGEFNETAKWSELIKSELHGFVAKREGNIVVLEKITEYASARKHHMFGIGNRDVLQTGWMLRIANSIRNSDLCKYEYREFGQKFLKTDSNLLKSFCGSSFNDFGFLYSVEDIYFICCVNQYLPQKLQYEGDFKLEGCTDED